METERAYLVKIGHHWIDLSRIELIEPPQWDEPAYANIVQLASGARVRLTDDEMKQLMDKLASLGMLAS